MRDGHGWQQAGAGEIESPSAKQRILSAIRRRPPAVQAVEQPGRPGFWARLFGRRG